MSVDAAKTAMHEHAQRIADLLDAGKTEEAQAEFRRIAQGEQLRRWQATVLADLVATKRKPLKP